MTSSWAHVGPSVLAAFLASLVEFVEALTIVLAVGTVRGWRPALIGSAAGAAVVVALVVILGPLLTSAVVPLFALQLVVGTLLLLFGTRWLRKAVLRAAGVVARHDEEKAFAEETALLRAGLGARVAARDPIAIATTFKAVVLEGTEVVFIVVAVGSAGGLLVPASLGAAAALGVVVLLGLLLHRPLAHVPENALKFTVGVLLSAFGVFWVGEGLGFGWPGGDWAIPALIGGFLSVALLAVALVRHREAAEPAGGRI